MISSSFKFIIYRDVQFSIVGLGVLESLVKIIYKTNGNI